MQLARDPRIIGALERISKADRTGIREHVQLGNIINELIGENVAPPGLLRAYNLYLGGSSALREARKYVETSRALARLGEIELKEVLNEYGKWGELVNQWYAGKRRNTRAISDFIRYSNVMPIGIARAYKERGLEPMDVLKLFYRADIRDHGCMGSYQPCHR